MNGVSALTARATLFNQCVGALAVHGQSSQYSNNYGLIVTQCL